MTAKVKSLNPDFDGRELHITVATAKKDGLAWVENIIFADDEGTSFLTQKNPISGGLLTTKPLEYATQVPQFVRENPSLPEYYPYIDIRSLMQHNPLIKQWKTLHQQTGKPEQQIEITSSSAEKIIDVADFSLERLDFDTTTYLMYQTDQLNAKGIAEVGLQHTGDLTSTTSFAGKISLPQTLEKMKAG
ncbi:MAG: hypothetical protein Q4B28_08550, partial [bacterium]|nr:hypothetical protein [bacterium]